MAASTPLIKTFPAVVVATAGSRQPLSATSVYVYSVSIESLQANTGFQYIGDATVTAANGIQIGPGNIVEIESPVVRAVDMFDLSKIYVDSSTNGAEFRIVAWIRE